MSMTELQNLPVWEWPDSARAEIFQTLANKSASADDRMLAAELAYDAATNSDEGVAILADIASDRGESIEMRGKAALAIGPALELAALGNWDEEGASVSEKAFNKIRKQIKVIFEDGTEDSELRRCVFEALVRAPEDWHKDAIREAYENPDDGWQRSAVFAMRFVSGFKDEILESLESEDEEVLFNAICAAAERQVRDAWPYVEELLGDEGTAREILLAAIDATPFLAPSADTASEALDHLLLSDDQDIVDAAMEAINASAEEGDDEEWDEDEEDEYDEDEDEDEDDEEQDEDDDGRRH
jgi:hypothetical protein